MSTRCNVIIQDEFNKLYFYRHSDGYPECTGESLKRFVRGYTKHKFRLNSSQSAGWLILHGHYEYGLTAYDAWKVGAYEPTSEIHADIEYKYIIDLVNRELRAYKIHFTDALPTLLTRDKF